MKSLLLLLSIFALFACSPKVTSIPKDTLPEFKGGPSALSRFITQHVHYPESARTDNVHGRVFINFVVRSDGSLSDFKVIRGVRKDLDDEALRGLKLMPKWIPGTKDGKPIDIVFTVPILF